jgi:NitT/TauT family transport system substrate-binding protein
MKIRMLLLVCLCALPAQAETLVKVGWCAPVISGGGANYAVAQKLGFFAEGGIKVQLVPLAGSIDCVKEVATGDLPYSQPSIEATAIIRQQNVPVRNFYRVYHENIHGAAVLADSPIQSFADLKGKTIGVTSMASNGVIVARALAADAGLNPDTDIRIVVVGEGAQAAVMTRNRQVDALSQFDAAYGLIEVTGVHLRRLDNSKIIKMPANGLIALERTLAEHRAEAVALGRGLAMGTLFTMRNPEAAIRILFEVYPQTKPLGKDDADALAAGLLPLQAVMHVFDPKGSGVARWGESDPANYQAYLDFLLQWGILKQRVDAGDLVSNALVDDMNRFDSAAVAATARARTN